MGAPLLWVAHGKPERARRHQRGLELLTAPRADRPLDGVVILPAAKHAKRTLAVPVIVGVQAQPTVARGPETRQRREQSWSICPVCRPVARIALAARGQRHVAGVERYRSAACRRAARHRASRRPASSRRPPRASQATPPAVRAVRPSCSPSTPTESSRSALAPSAPHALCRSADVTSEGAGTSRS